MRLPSEAEHFGGSGLRFALGVWRMAEIARGRPGHAMGGGAACERRIFGRRAQEGKMKTQRERSMSSKSLYGCRI